MYVVLMVKQRAVRLAFLAYTLRQSRLHSVPEVLQSCVVLLVQKRATRLLHHAYTCRRSCMHSALGVYQSYVVLLVKQRTVRLLTLRTRSDSSECTPHRECFFRTQCCWSNSAQYGRECSNSAQCWWPNSAQYGCCTTRTRSERRECTLHRE